MKILQELLALLKDVGTIYNNEGKGSNCIFYRFTPLISDGIIGQSRFEITVCNEKQSESLKKLDQIKRLLITVGSQQKTDNTLTIALAGGGYFFDKDIDSHCYKAIFSVSNKERMI